MAIANIEFIRSKDHERKPTMTSERTVVAQTASFSVVSRLAPFQTTKCDEIGHSRPSALTA